MIQIVFSRFKGSNHLTCYKNRRITSVIVYIFKTSFYSLRVNCIKNNKIVTFCLERLLKNAEMYWRHLRSNNCMSILHFLCKHLSLVSGRFFNLESSVMTLAFLNSRNERTDTDTDSTKVCAFINLNQSVHAVL